MEQQKYFIIEVGEDLQSTILFDILDRMKDEGHYFVVNYTTNKNQFDCKRVTKEEFNQYNGYEQD